MKKNKLLILVFAFIGLCDSFYSHAEIVYYTHPDLRLKFALNTNTKEASLGTGLDMNEQNAIALPPLGDPWWDESPSTNYWKDLDIPSTIICEGKAYSSNAGDVTIPRDTYTVTAVSAGAFYRSTRLHTIKLPETVQEIGNGAFYWCINLMSVNVPSQVTYIGKSTFMWCKKLETIHLPEHIHEIGRYAFSDCISLKEINIPGECTVISDEAFKNCKSLSKLTIEDGTEPLKVSFCYELGLDYEGTAPKYYRGMFSDCPLKKLHLGRDIEFFSVSIGGWYPPFMKKRYWGVGTDNKDVFINDDIYYEEVTIGDCVTTIPANMFQYASIPNTITLPSHLISIGDYAFANRSGTTGTLHQAQLNFPATLESIGKYAFENCSSLGTIVCEGTTPPSLPEELYYHAFWNCNPLFIVPQGCRNTYLAAENWSKHKIVESSDEIVTINVKNAGSLLDRLLAQGYQLGSISRLKLKGNLNDDDWGNIKKMSVLYDLDISELALEEISESQFENSSLIYIKLPQTIKKICDNAFYQCRSLSGTIEIPVSCTEIGRQAFRQTGITGLSYETPLHISDFAFSGCSNLEDLYIKGEGTICDYQSFGSCGLKKITIGKGVTLGESAVVLCDNLKEVVLEDGVKSLEEGSIYNLIEKLYIEGSVENISNYVIRTEYLQEVHISDIAKWCELKFPSNQHPLYKSNSSDLIPTLYYNDEEIVNLEIPEGVKSIGEYSFYKCKKLKTIKFPNSLRIIGSRAFEGCTLLEEMNLPSGLENIGLYTFSQCQSLLSIDIPESVSAISDGAFNKTKLEKIVVHWKEPMSIGSKTFYEVPYNCYLYIPIGTASKYSNAGWNCIPNMKAVGLLTLKVNTGGTVSSETYDISLTNKTDIFFFTPYQDFYIKIIPNDNYKIFKVKLNGEDVMSEIENGELYIEDPDEDIQLSVTFAEDQIEIGDVNGDEVFDEADVKNTANHIIKKPSSSFFEYAADMNDDGIINITDILLIIKKAKESAKKQ